MAIQYVCDGCNQVIQENKNRAINKLRLKDGNVVIEITAGFGNFGQGHLCDSCVKNAVLEGEPLNGDNVTDKQNRGEMP